MIQRKHTQLIQGGNIVMKIYTSYFAMMRNFPENIIPIAICAKPPTWYEGLVYKKLAPSYDILMQYKTQPNEELYTQRFASEILNNLDFTIVMKELEQLANGKDIALMCFEKPDDFCHRKLVAKHIISLGYEVSEFKKQ